MMRSANVAAAASAGATAAAAIRRRICSPSARPRATRCIRAGRKKPRWSNERAETSRCTDRLPAGRIVAARGRIAGCCGRPHAARKASRRADPFRARAARGRSAGRAGSLAVHVRPRPCHEPAAVRTHPRRIARPWPGHGRSGRGLPQERLRACRKGTTGLPAAVARIPRAAGARRGARRHRASHGSRLGRGSRALRPRGARRRLRAPHPHAARIHRDHSPGTAMNYFDQFAFQIYPYIALAVFFIGSWVRFDHSMYTWRSGSSQLLSSRGMRLGSNLFHVGILVVLGGHLVGLVTPHSVYALIISVPQKQLLAMVVGGVFGVICLIGMLILMARHLFNPRVKATDNIRNVLILALLMAQLLLGLYTIVQSSHHMDGSVMIALAEWAQHIATFRGDAWQYVVPVHWVYKTHIVLGMTIFLLTPFTRLVHIWSIPVSYLWRPYQVVRRRQPTLNYGPRTP